MTTIENTEYFICYKSAPMVKPELESAKKHF